MAAFAVDLDTFWFAVAYDDVDAFVDTDDVAVRVFLDAVDSVPFDELSNPNKFLIENFLFDDDDDVLV